MAFDNKLTNARGAFSFDKTAYGAIKFEITSISNPTVTVRNADQNGNTFIYNQTLPLGATSNAQRLEFNDPAAQLFTFDAKDNCGRVVWIDSWATAASRRTEHRIRRRRSSIRSSAKRSPDSCWRASRRTS